MPVIGYLNSASRDAFAPYVAAFLQGLKEGGFVEGQNVMIEYRSTEDKPERLPALAADLVAPSGLGTRRKLQWSGARRQAGYVDASDCVSDRW